MNKKRLGLIVMLFTMFYCSVFAAGYYGRNIPDSSEIREKIIDKWFLQDFNHLRMQEAEIYTNSHGQKFQVRLEDLDDSFAIVIAPQNILDIELITQTGKKETTIEVYPFDMPGSWILFRDKKTGTSLSVRYYFHKNPEIYVEIKNYKEDSFIQKKGDDNKVYGNFVLFDMYVAQDIPLGLTIKDLYVMSFDEVVAISGENFPWEYAAQETNLYDDTLQMIGCIREKVPSIKFDRDACYDGQNLPVRVSDGLPRPEIASENGISVDSFGFAKWIVDGLVYPISGSCLEVKPLRKQTVNMKIGSKADTMLSKYNMYLALDWTRNLAAAYLSVISNDIYTFETSGCEVNSRPFASKYTTKGTKTFPTYIKDSGYSVDSLKALFYIFAIKEPGRFYLGAVRETDNEIPQNVFYSRAVAFFPYFDIEGNYFVSVFENGKEYTIEEFMSQNEGLFVNLVRLQSSQRFFPQ